MKTGYPSKVKALLMVLIFSSVMVLGQAKRADADAGGGVALGAIAIFVTAVGTYATVMGVACTPIAAVKASDHPGGFSGAFGDCFGFGFNSETATAAANNDTPDTPDEEEDNGRDRYDD